MLVPIKVCLIAIFADEFKIMEKQCALLEENSLNHSPSYLLSVFYYCKSVLWCPLWLVLKLMAF